MILWVSEGEEGSGRGGVGFRGRGKVEEEEVNWRFNKDRKKAENNKNLI